jgi:hypothetical protein
MWGVVKALVAYLLLTLFFLTGQKIKVLYRAAFKVSPFELPDVFGIMNDRENTH